MECSKCRLVECVKNGLMDGVQHYKVKHVAATIHIVILNIIRKKTRNVLLPYNVFRRS